MRKWALKFAGVTFSTPINTYGEVCEEDSGVYLVLIAAEMQILELY